MSGFVELIIFVRVLVFVTEIVLGFGGLAQDSAKHLVDPVVEGFDLLLVFLSLELLSELRVEDMSEFSIKSCPNLTRDELLLLNSESCGDFLSLDLFIFFDGLDTAVSELVAPDLMLQIFGHLRVSKSSDGDFGHREAVGIDWLGLRG